MVGGRRSSSRWVEVKRAGAGGWRQEKQEQVGGGRRSRWVETGEAGDRRSRRSIILCSGDREGGKPADILA